MAPIPCIPANAGPVGPSESSMRITWVPAFAGTNGLLQDGPLALNLPSPSSTPSR